MNYIEEEMMQADAFLLHSEQICSHCGEELELLDSLVLLQVVYPGYDENGQLVYMAISTEKGGYLYDPQFFHSSCWGELWVDLEVHMEEEGFISTPDTEEHIPCSCCEAGTRYGEIMGLLSTGEFRRSQREPNGEGTIYFFPYTDMETLCVSCLSTFNEDLFEMWDNFGLAGVCPTGLHERCWRTGTCTNGCQYIRAAE